MQSLHFTYDGSESSPSRFDDWFQEDRGTGIDYEMEDDCDDVDEDEYDDPESF